MWYALASWALTFHSCLLVLDVKLLKRLKWRVGEVESIVGLRIFQDFIVKRIDNEWLFFQTLQAAELIDSEFRAGMSSRQKNKAKRMAKLFAKQRSRDAVEANEKRYNSELVFFYFS